MADPSVTPDDSMATIHRLIAEIAASQQRQAAMLRSMAGALMQTERALQRQVGMLTASSHDCQDCEVCGQPVPADQMAGFAARHGAVIHVNCLSTQMEGR